MAKKYIIIAVIIILGIGAIIYFASKNKNECKIVFYYSEECPFCQKVKSDGTIEKLEELGVKIEKIDVKKGLIKHKIEYIPAFVINNKIYEGYKTFEEIKDLIPCINK